MSQVPLAPPPPTKDPIFDRWVHLLWRRLTQSGQILWNTLDFTGSNLTDIETRNHNDLQNLDAGDYHHLTASQYADLTDGGSTTLHSHPGGSGATTGTTTADFGTGATDVQVAVADASITSASVTKAFVFASATATNTVDDHWVEDLEITAGNVVDGVGFTIYAKCNDGLAHGEFTIGWEYT